MPFAIALVSLAAGIALTAALLARHAGSMTEQALAGLSINLPPIL